MADQQAAVSALPTGRSPWPALWALVIGFFMILVDNTIVSVATPAILIDLHTDYNTAIWVTSAYLLAYAVPLLVTGRLGDRFGPRPVYLFGLIIFTLASLWCGLSGSIEMLIVARVVQGVGASFMTPQTMAVITRTFSPAHRGKAMALWGATAGVATLAGPILGGVLVDIASWEWIFIINVPIGIVAFVLAYRLVPTLETHHHAFDWAGVALSGAAVLLLVFGIQEGERYDWGTITGIISVPALIILGLLLVAVFVWWQNRITSEPLVPLSLFRDRNFSVSNAGIAMVSLAVTAMALPFTFYAQGARGWTPTQAALLMVPMAVMLIVCSPLVGKLVDRINPRSITLVGFALAAASIFCLLLIIDPTTPVWQLCLPMATFGIANACLWAPLTATATRNLPMAAAGAGAGVYNTTRQIAAALGSAAIAAVISARLAHHGLSGGADQLRAEQSMPAQIQGPYSEAMAQALWVPVIAYLVGLIIVLFMVRPSHAGHGRAPANS